MMIDNVLCWIESHPGLAAWVQACGTFVALTIAIGVPWYIHQKEGEERTAEKLLQAQGLALLIRPSLIVLIGKLEREERLLTGGVPSQALSPIKLPTAIMEQVNLFWLMGGAGGHVLQLIATLDADDQLVSDYKALVDINGVPDRQEANRKLEIRKSCLQVAQADATDALALIKVLLDDRS